MRQRLNFLRLLPGVDRRGLVCHIGAACSQDDNGTGLLEFVVGVPHSVQINLQVNRQLPHRRQLFARTHDPAADGAQHLVADLHVNGHSGVDDVKVQHESSVYDNMHTVLHELTVVKRSCQNAMVQGADRMNRKLISSGSTFEAQIGYSRAVVQGDWVFVSGTTGFDYATMTIAEGIVEQTEQCLKNIILALQQAGATLQDVVRVNYVVPKADEFPECWPVLRKFFGEIRPAAMMICAGLADPRMRIEIEVTALRRT